MSAAKRVRHVRHVRAGVRALNRAQSLAGRGVCGMCGIASTWAGACAKDRHAIPVATATHVRMAARTSRTQRTAHVLQRIRLIRMPHSRQHVPHMLARAVLFTSTAFKGNGEGGRNG